MKIGSLCPFKFINMKRIILTILCILCTMAVGFSQEKGSNEIPDSITGNYFVKHGGEDSKVKIFKKADGTYCAQVYWLQNRLDSNGNVRLDENNPDKSKRNTPCDQIILMEGISYNGAKKRWDGGKIYDPTRGIRANATCSFDTDSTLKIRGSVMGIGETVVWKKIAE